MARAKGFYIKSDLTNEIKKAASDIGKYGDGAQRRMKMVIRKGTQDALSAAKSKAPIATGGIVKRLVMEYDEKNNRGFVKSKAPHSVLLEKGVKPSVVVPTKKMALKFNGNFAKWANLPARKARPFMKPALDEVEPKIIKALKEAVEP